MQLCIGNSVVAIGLAGGIGAGLSTLGGGEANEITHLVHEGAIIQDRETFFDTVNGGKN